MAASRNKRKTAPRKKPRRWIIPKILMLLGIGGLVAFIVAIFVMEQELGRIGFFKNIKRPSFQLPAPLQNNSSTSLPAVSSPPTRVEPPPQEAAKPATSASARATEDLSREDRKKQQDATTSRSTEKLLPDDRKRLEEVLRSR